MPLVVSLTSYPARFPTLALTLRSLLRQTVAADRTILWIADKDLAALPADVRELEGDGLDIRAAADTRSYKKILPVLDAFPGTFVCTADDDTYYFSTWLEEMVAEASRGDAVVTCHRAHGIGLAADGSYAPYDKWQHDVVSRGEAPNLFATGVGGVLYPPGVLDHGAEERQAAFELCPEADDVWLYWIARRNGARYRTVGRHRAFVAWKDSQTHSLWQDNVSRGRNDEQIGAMGARFGFPDISTPRE